MAWDDTNITTSGENKRKKVAICIPHTGWFHTEFTYRTWLPLMFPVSWCEKIPMHSKDYSITVARNELVQSAIQHKADYILWVDSDMVIESVGVKDEEEKQEDGSMKKVTKPFKTSDPNLALKGLFDFMEQHNDINMISGLYRAKKKEGFSYAAWLKNPKGKGYFPIVEHSGNFIEVDAIGLGFCLMRTEAFKKIEIKEGENSYYFKWNKKDDLSEDFNLCKRLKEKGVKIHLFTDIRLSHWGDLWINSDGSIRVREA